MRKYYFLRFEKDSLGKTRNVLHSCKVAELNPKLLNATEPKYEKIWMK